MNVVTLNGAAFKAAVASLQSLCEVCRPELVVGIATGGDVVARAMFGDLAHATVTCRRPGTAHKARAGLLMRTVRLMPLCIRDALRVAEASLLGMHRSPVRHVGIEDEDRRLIASAGRILIVDDAVDSGSTLGAVLTAVHGINPGATVFSAAVTVTEDRPLVTPDYTLYNNGTLVRFPWSMDNRHPQA